MPFGPCRLIPTLLCLAGFPALASSGCSFIFVERPPADHAARASFGCTSGYTAPILDGVYAGLQTVGLASLAQAEEEDRLSSEALAVQVGVAVVAAASAVYGITAVGGCREAREELTLRVAHERSELLRYRHAQLQLPQSALPPGPVPDAPAATPMPPDVDHGQPVEATAP